MFQCSRITIYDRSVFKRLWLNGCSLIFLLLAVAHSPAASPEYLTHVWQVEDGLPQNAVTAILQTKDGYLWLGTYGGLVRFDGVNFKVFDNLNTAGLESGRVTSLFEDDSGNLWIGHEGGDLTRFKNDQFESVSLPAKWKGGKIISIEGDAAGDIWAVNETGLAMRVRDGLTLAPPSGTAPGQLRVSKSADDNIWIIRDGRISLLKDGKLSPVEFGNGMENAYVQNACANRTGDIWVASDGQLQEWHGNRLVKDLGEAPWGTSAVSDMLETRQGNVAVGTVDSGLFLISPKRKISQFNSTNGLPQNWVRSLYEDREGNLWVGAGSAGLVALRESRVGTVSPPDHWQGRAILSVNSAPDGTMWVGTEGTGLYCCQNGTWKHFGEAEGLSNGFIWSISEDTRRRIWAGTWSGGIFVKQGERFAPAPGLELITIPTPALLNTADGVLWAGTGDGLLRYQNGVKTWFGRNDDQSPMDIHAVVQARDGTIWFGMSDGGLGCLKNGTIHQFRRKDGLSSDFVQCLHFDSEGTLWIGTSGGGLNRLKRGCFAAITSTQGLANDVICNIEEDDHGYLWLSSHGGIMRLSKSGLNRCADGVTNRVDCLSYGRGEGLPTLECSAGGQPTGCKTADGRLWFATSKGLVVVDPNNVHLNSLPPPVLIESLRVNDHPISFATKKSTPLQIPPGQQRFEFQYTGLSFVDPEKVRFKYRLEGLEPQWVDAAAKREANYSFIPPGDYVFHVIACNNDGIWNDTGATLAFTVLPLFWQTWWFRVATGLVAAASIGGIVLFETRRRMHQRLEKSERQHAIERERTRIAKDIHDDLGASLTRITMLSQSARAETENPATASELDRIYDTARELTRAMDEIVWAVNPKHDTLDSLATYLGRFAQDFLATANIRCRLDFPVYLPPWSLTAETRHNLFLAFKEALNNAVKHASTPEVHISLSIERTGFSLCAADRGKGFSFAESESQAVRKDARFASGNGLRNMRQRLKEIGGRCEIHSAPGEGTKVIFIVSVRKSES